MSFGVSPSDVIKLVEVSSRIYVAFKDANDNSATVVEGLVKEFSTFHSCLLQLEDLMKEYGKPLPFPYLDFQETLRRCEKTLEPYANHLVDNRRTSIMKVYYTIKYIGKEKEIENLRKQINGHWQAMQMCISFLQLCVNLQGYLVHTLMLDSRLHLEQTKQTQRLLDSTPIYRTMSFGGHVYTNYSLGSSRPSPHALPEPSEADQLYRDWVRFDRLLKHEDERIVAEAGVFTRPLSQGSVPAVVPSGDADTAAALYRLRRELQAAIKIEENRAKRTAAEQRSHLSASDAISDAMRREVQDMPKIPPQRTYTLETDHSGDFSGFGNQSLSDSGLTIRPEPKVSPSQSPSLSPTGSPQIDRSYFPPIDWGNLSPDLQRTPSTHTSGSEFSRSPESTFSATGLGINTSETTPVDHPLRSRHSSATLASLALGKGALEWNSLCRKVDVEREAPGEKRSQQCDIFWRYRKDTGISVRSLYKSGKGTKEWMVQHFPATGPSIPLTTSYEGGSTSMDFPRQSFGQLEKKCTNVIYTFASHEASKPLQTLLYTNNGKDDAELLYDRPIKTISSNKNSSPPECRSKNIRLWRRTEEHEGPEGLVAVDVLILLFFTSALLKEEKKHWVEEPHYAFQWLDESVYGKKSDELKLTFSKEPRKWTGDKLFRRKSSKQDDEISAADQVALALRRSPLERQDTASSAASPQASIKSGTSSIFGSGRPRSVRNGHLNRFEYTDLKIEFQSKKDRREFLEVWKQYVKPKNWT